VICAGDGEAVHWLLFIRGSRLQPEPGGFGQNSASRTTNLIGRAWDSFGQLHLTGSSAARAIFSFNFTDPWDQKATSTAQPFGARWFIQSGRSPDLSKPGQRHINTRPSDLPTKLEARALSYTSNSRQATRKGRRFDSVNEAEDESPGKQLAL